MNVHPRISEARLDASPAALAQSKPHGLLCVAALIAGGVLTLAWIALLGWLLMKAALIVF